MPGIVVTARFETTCQGPPVDSDDPADVIRALEEASNARDRDAVCSLFSDDATARLFSSDELEVFEGNEAIAEEITAQDDNLWLQRIEYLDIETSEDVVSWKAVLSTHAGTIEWCHTAEVENRKIVTTDQRPCPGDD
jgi:hypothetical protein